MSDESDISDVEEEFHVPKLNEDDDEADSDKELQVAYQSGLLKPGMFRPITAPPPVINNKEGLLDKLDEIMQTDLDWVERLDVTVDLNINQNGSAETESIDVHNDFKREVSFYEQAKESVIIAMKRLHEAGVSTKRPEDYFAEMAKKDDHMKRVREKLLSLQRRREAIDKNKTNVKLKKYGKQVQQAVVKERQQKKKEMLTAVKKYQKGKTKNLDFLDETTEKIASNKKTSQLQKLQQQNKLNPKRTYKNKKFGFGGKKKGSKMNNKKSFNEVSGKFKRSVHSNKGKKQRPGKSKRVKTKSKR